MLNDYKTLLQAVYDGRNNYSEENLSVFNCAKGSKYDNQFLIVGRAVNGWNNFSKVEALNQLDEVERNLGDDLQWVIDQWGSTTEYNTKKSPFWRVNRRIADHFFGEVEDNINFLSWSNLYKVSKAKSGNPSNRLADLQLEICKKILFNEIKELCPKYVIFLTSWGWAQWFLNNDENVTLKKIEGKEFVELIGTIHYIDANGFARKSYLIVGQHPQCKSEERHTAEIIEQIENFKSKRDYR